MKIDYNTRLWQVLNERNAHLENKKLFPDFIVNSVFISATRPFQQDVVLDIYSPHHARQLKVSGIREDISYLLKNALGEERYLIDDASTLSPTELINLFNQKYNVELSADDLIIDNPGKGTVRLTYTELNPSYYGWFTIVDSTYVHAPNTGGGAGGGANITWNTLGW